MRDYDRKPSFKSGDVVELKATGLRVTVEGFGQGIDYYKDGTRLVGVSLLLAGGIADTQEYYTGEVGIVWFDHQSQLHRDTVPEECLQLYVDPVKFDVNGVPKLDLSTVDTVVSRQRIAQLLIEQLPEDHEGRNSWLLNYGVGEEYVNSRIVCGVSWDSANHAAFRAG